MKTGFARTIALSGAACLMLGTTTVAVAGPASASPRSNYLNEARSYDGDLGSVSNYTLWKVGKSTCKVLDQGGHFNMILRLFNNADIPTNAQAAIVVAAVHNLCPGHQAFLDRWLAS
jgi:hypothetical protein